jgi:aromatic-L-amino-acid decarboxylase
VDGCIGALIAIAPQNAYRAAGIERADSIALDPHKWLHAPFEAGCAIVRDAAMHRSAFGVTPEYLESRPHGLAAAPWLHEYGLQTSRGFRALKIWMAIKEHGIDKFGRLIDQKIAQGHYLSSRIEKEPRLELAVPANINIVCFRYRADGLAPEALNIRTSVSRSRAGLASFAAKSPSSCSRQAPSFGIGCTRRS